MQSKLLIALFAFLAAQAVNAEFCGGIAAIKCPDGQVCALDGTYPDAGGHCQIVSPEGGPCGGKRVTPTVCAEGLVCNEPQPSADQGGICVKPVTGAGLGQMCAGFAGIQCQKPYVCCVKDSFPDASGICIRRGTRCPKPKA